MTRLANFIAAFGVWEEARPYAHLMVDEQELELILALGDSVVTVQEVAPLIGKSHEQTSTLLQRAYARHIVNKKTEDRITYYTAASFHERLDHFAKFGAWDDIPAEDRRAIDRRFLDEFIARHRASIERAIEGVEGELDLPNDTVLLLSEIEEMLDAATHIVVQPCDCRRLGQNCSRPVETCIWLDDSALDTLDRGHGRRLTRQQAKELVHWADKQGLMHTADADWQARGLDAICNCCACDCYPFRAAQELGSKGIWPRSRYMAIHDVQRCNLCGACVQRCHFEAFFHDGTVVEIDAKTAKNIDFEPDRCWGCGLCANTCPTGAIVMQRI